MCPLMSKVDLANRVNQVRKTADTDEVPVKLLEKVDIPN